jgi:predicted O-methyltransferase YrrM
MQVFERLPNHRFRHPNRVKLCYPQLSRRLNRITMNSPSTDRAFTGSIPELYQQYLVPLIFEPYAADLTSRVALHQPKRVLEIAAGTGVVTRHLARELPKEASIVATDLNQPMLDQAAAIKASRAVEWRQADAHAVAVLGWGL